MNGVLGVRQDRQKLLEGPLAQTQHLLFVSELSPDQPSWGRGVQVKSRLCTARKRPERPSGFQCCSWLVPICVCHPIKWCAENKVWLRAPAIEILFFPRASHLAGPSFLWFYFVLGCVCVCYMQQTSVQRCTPMQAYSEARGGCWVSCSLDLWVIPLRWGISLNKKPTVLVKL